MFEIPPDNCLSANTLTKAVVASPASTGPLFWQSMLSAVSLFSRFGSLYFVLILFIDAIINKAHCACHQYTD